LVFRLEALDVREETPRRGEITKLMERAGEGCALAHSLKRVATAVGEIDRLAGGGDGFWYVAEGEEELAKIAVTNGSIPPTLQLQIAFGPGPYRLDGIGQPADRAEGEPGFGDHPRLIDW
jgi:hypothetical protein